MHSIAILTPTWNRGYLLRGLYESLLAQTYTCFEWIVVDDGSDDDTELIILALSRVSPFPITYARYSKRVGKVRADNTLLDLNNSDFIIWCDSDDKLMPNALQELIETWSLIKDDASESFIGVISLCQDQNGAIQSTGKTSFSPFISAWKDLENCHEMTGDMCIMQQSSVISDKRFPEHDLVMSESGFWWQFMHMNVICVPSILKIMKRDTLNRISGSQKMEYCRGKAYSIIYADSSSFAQKSIYKQMTIACAFHRYCFHGDIDFRQRVKLFRGKTTFLFWLGALVGYAQALKDILLGRVNKTHVIFEEGKNATIALHRNF